MSSVGVGFSRGAGQSTIDNLQSGHEGINSVGCCSAYMLSRGNLARFLGDNWCLCRPCMRNVTAKRRSYIATEGADGGVSCVAGRGRFGRDRVAAGRLESADRCCADCSLMERTPGDWPGTTVGRSTPCGAAAAANAAGWSQRKHCQDCRWASTHSYSLSTGYGFASGNGNGYSMTWR